jgi:hypothetical protein
VPDLRRIDVRQPVVGDDLAGDVEDQPAERIALVGLDPPIGAVDVFVDRRGHVDPCAPVFAQAPVLVAVSYVGAKGAQVVGLDQHLFDDVLYLFDRRIGTREAVAQHLQHALREQFGLVFVEFPRSLSGARERHGDAPRLEGCAASVTLDDPARERLLGRLYRFCLLSCCMVRHRSAP